MLPDGFQWQPWCGDSIALTVNGVMAALCVPVSTGACRVETGIGRLNLHIRFQPSPAQGRAYVEAWARKWEAQLLATYRPGDSMVPSRHLPGNPASGAPRPGGVDSPLNCHRG